jgi:hypothetical protein
MVGHTSKKRLANSDHYIALGDRRLLMHIGGEQKLLYQHNDIHDYLQMALPSACLAFHIFT